MKAPENFKAKRLSEVKNPRKLEGLTVQDHMTKRLVTFHPEQSVRDVMDKLIRKNISGGPVVDDSGKLVGIISEGDCLKQVVKAKYHNGPGDKERVADHMQADVITVGPDESVFDIAKKFLDMKIRRFPVLDQGKLVGQISQKDVMKAVRVMNRTTW